MVECVGGAVRAGHIGAVRECSFHTSENGTFELDASSISSNHTGENFKEYWGVFTYTIYGVYDFFFKVHFFLFLDHGLVASRGFMDYWPTAFSASL